MRLRVLVRRWVRVRDVSSLVCCWAVDLWSLDVGGSLRLLSSDWLWAVPVVLSWRFQGARRRHMPHGHATGCVICRMHAPRAATAPRIDRTMPFFASASVRAAQPVRYTRALVKRGKGALS